jgi:putative flippase GtrA
MTPRIAAKSHESNDFSIRKFCKKEGASWQAIETTTVSRTGASQGALSSDFSLSQNALNSNDVSQMSGSAPRSATWNSPNTLAVSCLRRIERPRREEKSPTKSTLVRWLKFNFVGGVGIFVQFVALYVLKGVMHFNYLAATALAVEIAVVHNFVWHEQFTWADTVQPSWRTSGPRFARFNLTTGAVSIVGNLILMKVLVAFGHMNYLPANAIAIALCSLANFVVSELWVFGKPSGR